MCSQCEVASNLALALNGILREAESTGNSTQSKFFFDPQEPIPFEELVAPFVINARRQVVDRVGGLELLSEQAQTRLERNLLQRLTDLCASTLELEYSVFRALRRPALMRWLATEPTGESNALYRAFVQEMLDGGFRSFFQEYAVLARLTALTIDSWIDAVSEFLLRLTNDREALAEMWGTESVAGPVTNIQPFLGDLHAEGRASHCHQVRLGAAAHI